MGDKVSFVCTTFRRFTCVKRIVYQYYQQTHKNKELIIFNTDTEYPIQLGFKDDSIIVINNDTNYLTGLPYTSRGQICRDAVTHASGDYFMLADDDDIYLPWHLEQAVKGIEANGKDAWKPEKSLFGRRTHPKIIFSQNVMEASVIVKMNRIREIGFRTDVTGYEGMLWYDKLKDEKQLDENNKDYVPSYCFNWGDPPEIAGHKQSGNIGGPNNFENHKKESKDVARTLLSKEEFHDLYKPYYRFLIENLNSLNLEYFDKYAQRHIAEKRPLNVVYPIKDIKIAMKVVYPTKNV